MNNYIDIVLDKARNKINSENFVTISCKIHKSDAELFATLTSKYGLKPSKVLNSFIYDFIENKKNILDSNSLFDSSNENICGVKSHQATENKIADSLELKKNTLKKAKSLDQFFTSPKTVDEVLNKLDEILSSVNLSPKNYNYLEPSAGSGFFISGIENKFSPRKIYAYDLEPQSDNIVQADFLKTQPIYSKNNIIVGNPPFGKRAKLAIDFVNQSFKWGDILIMILPLQFNRFSVQKQISNDLKLIYSSSTLPKNSFLLDKKPYSVNCLIQMWVKKTNQEFCHFKDLRIKDAPVNKHSDFKTYIYNLSLGDSGK